MNTKNAQSNKGKNFVGTVVALHGEKTVKVEVSYVKKHPIYKKSLKRTRRFACHNELSDIGVGDTVEICQVRPMSRTKHFSLVKKI
jgi:small subunit ribosomal protein S17